MELPAPTYSIAFGTINKARWYRVTNVNGNYNLNLYIQTQQTKSSSVSITNRTNSTTQWSQNIPANTNKSVLNIPVSITHNTTLNAREYVILNSSQIYK